ncbi:DNA mismatch repair protein Mlh1, partial [Dictyocoela roeselum]
KELLENSLDAQATEIEIIIPEKKNDGPGIEIRDNGIGIEKDDFVLLCARHCTSKFKSLDEISSFGFRGEALASIALIADVTVESYASFITEKITGEGCNYDADHGCHTKDVENSEAYGYIGEYKNANLVSLKPKAMKKGTFIRINNIHKECTLKMDKRECITLIVNYQLDNPNVKITMNGIGDAYHTFLSPFDRSKIINHFYKTGDLIIDESERYCFVSSYPLKKFTLVLFVNGRLVTNTKIRNEILKIYKKIFPTKKFPFVYLSLKINHVDVNVHPRKKEVLIEQMPDLDFIGDVMDNKRGIKKIKTVDFKSSNNEVGAKNAKKIYTDPTESTIEESILSSINESIPFDSAKSQNTNIANNSYGNRNFLKLLGVSTDFVDKRSNSEIVKVEYNRGNDRGK